MSNSLLKLSQQYANGQLEKNEYRQLRRQAIEQNLAVAEDQTAQNVAKKVVQSEQLTRTDSNSSKPQNIKLYVGAVVVILVVILVVAFTGDKKAQIEEVKAPLSLLMQQFHTMIADGEIELDENEIFFELWDKSSPQQQQKWQEAVEKEQVDFANSTEHVQNERLKHIKTLLSEIEDMNKEEVFDQQPDADEELESEFDEPTDTVPEVEVAEQQVQSQDQIQGLAQPSKPASEIVEDQQPVTSDENTKRQNDVIELPKVTGNESKQEVISNEEQSSEVKEKQQSKLIETVKSETSANITSLTVDATHYHTVKKGENLSKISKEYNVLMSAIEQMNPNVKEGVKADQKLVVAGIIKHKVASDETIYSIAKQYKLTQRQLIALNPSIKNRLLADSYVVIKIVSLDTIKSNQSVKDNLLVLTDAFNRLANDEELTIESLQAFNKQWKGASSATRLKIGEFPRFNQLSRRLLKQYDVLKQSETKPIHTYRKSLLKSLKSVDWVKKRKEKES